MDHEYVRPSLRWWFQKLTLWNCDSFPRNLEGCVGERIITYPPELCKVHHDV